MDNELIKEVRVRATEWLTPAYDEATQAEVKNMLDAEDPAPLVDAFYRDLEFGTGGLRGIMGAGTNRMNIYTVGMATQGLANYLHKAFPTLKQISVVVCHDCRNNSRLFAKTCADIFSANDIKVYLFDDLRPTPECSFAIRHLVARAASTSPPATTPANTTATRPTGTTEPRCSLPTTRASSTRWVRSVSRT